MRKIKKTFALVLLRTKLLIIVYFNYTYSVKNVKHSRGEGGSRFGTPLILNIGAI